MRKIAVVLIITSAISFSAGYYYASTKQVTPPQFHDMRVNYISDYTRLVTPDHPKIISLSAQLGGPIGAYNYVRDYIRFDPRRPASPPLDVLKEKAGSCLGKAILLCSLYRAMGFPAEKVRIVTGEVITQDAIVEHAWLDLEYKGKCLQQDPTNLIGKFGFFDFPDSRYTTAFIRKENYCFNDTGFAVVSQLNRFKEKVNRTRPPHR